MEVTRTICVFALLLGVSQAWAGNDDSSNANIAIAWNFDKAASLETSVQSGSAGAKPVFAVAGDAAFLAQGMEGGGLSLSGTLSVGPFPQLTRERYKSSTFSGAFRLMELPQTPQALGGFSDMKKSERVRLTVYPDGHLRFCDVRNVSGKAEVSEVPWYGPTVKAGAWHTLTFGISQSWKGDVCWAFLDGVFASEWMATGGGFSNLWEWRSLGSPLQLDNLRICTGVATPKVQAQFVKTLPSWEGDDRLPPAETILLHATFDGKVDPEIGSKLLSKAPLHPAYENGVMGKGLLLKDKEYISFNVSDLSPERGTIALWIKPVDFNPTDKFGMPVFSGPGPISLNIRGGTRKGMPFIFGDNYLKNIGWFEPDFPYGANEWVQIIVTWSSPSVSIYLNGRLFNGAEMNCDNVQVTQLGYPGWGKNPQITFTKTNPAVMDELLILNTSLSKSEAEALYKRYTEPMPPKASGARENRFASLTYYPYEEKLTVALDMSKAPVTRPCDVTVDITDSNGKALIDPIKRTVKDSGARFELISLPRPLAPGKYIVTVTAVNQGKKVSDCQPFFRRKFDWLDNPVEAKPRLLKPWTPIELKMPEGTPVTGKAYYEVSVWGRAYTLDGFGLPMQMISTQEEPTRGAGIQSELAAPAKLEVTVAGKSQTCLLGKSAITLQQPHQLDIAASAVSAGLALENRSRLEFDGALFHDLTIKSAGADPVSVDRMRLIIPLRSELCRYFHLTADGIRVLKRSGYIPSQGDGLVWGSKTHYWDAGGIPPRDGWGVPSSTNWLGAGKRTHGFGSLIPYLWVGDEDRGFCWWTDTGKGWAFDPAQNTLELIREGDAVFLVVNFIQTKTVIDAPRTFSYAMMATPSKPMPPQWRNFISRTNGRQSPSVWARGQMDLAPSDEYVGRVKGTDLLWNKAAEKKTYNFMYTDFRSQAQGTPEWEYFKTVWAPQLEANPAAEYEPQVSFIDPDSFKDYYSIDPRMYSSGLGLPVSSNLHYRAYILDWLIKNCGWNGIYQDDTYMWYLAWPLYGKGYPLQDGKWQPEYTQYWWREAMKRQHAVFEGNGIPYPANVLHATSAIFASAMNFGTVIYDGEWGNHEGCRDWLEKWNPDVLRASSIGRHLGLVPTWHPNQMTSATASKDEPAEYRRAQGSLLLHDIWRFGTLDAPIPGERERMSWANSGKTVTFHPYWAEPAEISTDSPSVLASAYRCKETGETLITVVNYLDKAHAVKIFMPAEWLTGKKATAASPHKVEPAKYDAAWSADVKAEGRTLELNVSGRDARVILLK